MTRLRRYGTPIAVTLSVLGALACVVLGVFAFLYVRQQQARAQFEPPSVTITDPASGASVLADSHMAVSATAFGSIPITRAELWVDGQLIDTQESRDQEGVSPFYVSFDLTVSQGLHTLFVRAVNAMGIMGDSWPVNVGGAERPGPDDPARVVTVEEGETLEDIAAAYDANPETVRQLNPDLGGQQPPVGSRVVLPPPQSKAPEGPGEPPAQPPVGPSLPPGGTEPPGGGPLPPPWGPRLAVLPEALPISTRDILDLALAGSPPAAPTDLQAEVTGCNIHLRWNDNADNEAWYEVWYLWSFSYDSRLIAKLEPADLEPGAGAQVYFEFPAPSEGTFFFWVYAVNFWGRQRSNVVGPGGVVVAGDCPRTLATHLQVEALDMAVPGGYDRVYCYLSFEGARRYFRVPSGELERDFVEAAAGVANIGPWASGDRKLLVPIPKDESLEVQGECWGWSGGELSELGGCSGIYPRETWDGTRHLLQGSDFIIGVAIKPLEGALDTSGLTTSFGYVDLMMPYPYDVSEDTVRSWLWIDPLTRALSWKWDGDPNEISGFQILLNGVPYNAGGGWSLVDPEARSALVRVPQECGGHISWQVRAVAGQAVSRLSPLTKDNDYDQPKCPEPVYAMVKFNTITFIDDCDNLDLYWFLRLNGVTKHFGTSCDPRLDFPWPYCAGGWHHIDDNCGPHSLASLCSGLTGCSDPNFDTVVAALGQTAMGGGGGPISIEVVDGFWDTMILVGGDDNVGVHRVLYEFPSIQDAQQKLGCGRDVCVGPGTGDPYATEYRGYDATMCYTLYIFPQPEGLNCPVSEPAYNP